MNSSNSSELDYYDYDDEAWLKFCLAENAEYGCDVYCIVQLIFVIFTGVTLPVYLIVLYVLIRYRKDLNSSYFTFCISAGFADVLYTVFKYCFQMLPYWFFFEKTLNNIYLATIAKIGHWGVYYTQVFGVILMVTNRFSAIACPMQYTNFWTNEKVAVAITVQWLLPLPLVTPMIASLVLHAIDYDGESLFWVKVSGFHSFFECTFSPIMKDAKIYNIYMLFGAMLEPLLVLLILILHVLMVIQQTKYSKKTYRTGSQRSADHRQHRRELRLAFSGFVITVLYSSMVILMVLQFLEVYYVFIAYVFYYISDIFTAINPFLLILFSHKVRKYFSGIICFWKKTTRGKVSTVGRNRPYSYDPKHSSAVNRNVPLTSQTTEAIVSASPLSTSRTNRVASVSLRLALDSRKSSTARASLHPDPRRKSTEPAASPSHLSLASSDRSAARSVSRTSSVGMGGLMTPKENPDRPASPSPYFVFRADSIESFGSADFDEPDEDLKVITYPGPTDHRALSRSSTASGTLARPVLNVFFESPSSTTLDGEVNVTKF